jgi:hypothetical protein
MKLTIAEKYKTALEALPVERQTEPLWEQPGFEAEISYGPAPHRERILKFRDGSVFYYDDHYALSSDKSSVGSSTGWR